MRKHLKRNLALCMLSCSVSSLGFPGLAHMENLQKEGQNLEHMIQAIDEEEGRRDVKDSIKLSDDLKEAIKKTDEEAFGEQADGDDKKQEKEQEQEKEKIEKDTTKKEPLEGKDKTEKEKIRASDEPKPNSSSPSPSSNEKEIKKSDGSNKEDLQKKDDVGEEEQRFTLKGVKFQSDIDIKESILRKEAEKYVGTRVSLNDLKKIAKNLTRICRSEGYLGAIAYLPEQSSTDGTITFGVASGTFRKATVHNYSTMKTAIIEEMILGKIKDHEIVQAKKLEEGLYRINGLGGVKATASLSRALDSKGQVDVDIDVQDAPKGRLIVYTENYGTKSAGRYRLGAVYDAYNIDNHGSNLQAMAVISNEKMQNYSLDFNMLTDKRSASRIGINVARTTYHLTREFEVWDASGKSFDVSLYHKTPISKTLNYGLEYQLGYKHRTPESDFHAFGIENKRTIHEFYQQFDGYQRFKNGIFNYNAKLTIGSVHNDTEDSEYLNSLASGTFAKLNAGFDTKYLLDPRWELHVKGDFQFASKRLDSSEKMYLGGANGVRAYSDGDGNGDNGALFSGEIIYNTKFPGFSVNLFYDYGIAQNKGWGAQREHIKGYGIGLRFSRPNDFFIKVDWAHKIGFNHNVTSDTGKNQIWFMVGKII